MKSEDLRLCWVGVVHMYGCNRRFWSESWWGAGSPSCLSLWASDKRSPWVLFSCSSWIYEHRLFTAVLRSSPDVLLDLRISPGSFTTPPGINPRVRHHPHEIIIKQTRCFPWCITLWLTISGPSQRGYSSSSLLTAPGGEEPSQTREDLQRTEAHIHRIFISP